ncbi:MAG: hypothetical protein IPH69_06330 [Bacteroidales bacterium]|nr:hypothetical protein [Bacteroidales bacterium]MBK7627474.1 hypothetical protein [Bacteroidales bacterium]
MKGNPSVKSFIAIIVLSMVLFITFIGCDIVTIEREVIPLPKHERDVKPDYPVELGTIRGYFGDYYLTFRDHIEKVAPVDSFSNCYFYGNCENGSKQINLLRCDSTSVLAIYILGYYLDSLPSSLPVQPEFGKFTEIQYYAFNRWNSTDPGHYSLINFYGESVFITDKKDDIITGTFQGTLRSTDGGVIPVTDGEFKLKIFRKFMPCAPEN